MPRVRHPVYKKWGERMNDALLEYIAAQAGCTFLSDLHLPAVRARVFPLLEGLPCAQFSLAQWNEAVSYLMGQPHVFCSIDEAKAFLHSVAAPRQ